jgi:hypothetical protein
MKYLLRTLALLLLLEVSCISQKEVVLKINGVQSYKLTQLKDGAILRSLKISSDDKRFRDVEKILLSLDKNDDGSYFWKDYTSYVPSVTVETQNFYINFTDTLVVINTNNGDENSRVETQYCRFATSNDMELRNQIIQILSSDPSSTDHDNGFIPLHNQ